MRKLEHYGWIEIETDKSDIDVGGFRIYRDLCKKTDIPFQTYHMGIRELKRYETYTKKLTDNDRKGLRMLIEKAMEDDRNFKFCDKKHSENQS